MQVYFITSYFSRSCGCMIPGHWRAEQDGFYGDGETEQDAIDTLHENMQ